MHYSINNTIRPMFNDYTHRTREAITEIPETPSIYKPTRTLRTVRPTEAVPEPEPIPTGNSTHYGCWHCDAKDWNSCYKIGSYSKCSDRQVCMTEIRERNGAVFSICMRCKLESACIAQRANNFATGFAQCRPKKQETETPSVCRQCCAFDRCTDNYNPPTVWGWKTGPVKKWRSFLAIKQALNFSN